jgi:hypothetical protein
VCLTVGFRDIEGDHNSNVSSYCHLRVYRNNRKTVKISEGALPYELDKFGDKALFNPKHILQKHIPTREYGMVGMIGEYGVCLGRLLYSSMRVVVKRGVQDCSWRKFRGCSQYADGERVLILNSGYTFPIPYVRPRIQYSQSLCHQTAPPSQSFPSSGERGSVWISLSYPSNGARKPRCYVLPGFCLGQLGSGYLFSCSRNKG